MLNSELVNLTGVGNLFQKLMDKFILGAHFVLKDKTGVRSMCEYRHFPSKAKSIKVKTRRLVRETTGDIAHLRKKSCRVYQRNS